MGESRLEVRLAHWGRRGPLVAGIGAIVLTGILGIIIALRGSNQFSVDLSWMSEIIEHRSPLWTAPALFFDYAGGGVVGTIIVPPAIVLILVAFRRFWGAAFFAIASVASVVTVEILKNTVDRTRPQEILVATDFGSFPSGHTADAATMAGVLMLLFPRIWVWISGVGWMALMAFSRTYLGAHWLSDTVGGVLLGGGIALITWAVLARPLAREREQPHRFIRHRTPT
ncbi:phosphatase PAP2 family protein [Gryllotalpicola sp.]|uniref:phosphatase PAP2 family protein n=1 Tax=Gryllotalpicola sp. TaxID=1932787 RepID=UPI0026019BA7|nr:phosphatase PAP2 family protein [Gryllotalpicola sp.]